VYIIEDADFVDSMSITWDSELIAAKLLAAFAPDAAKAKTDKPPQSNIDTIITFDPDGVSSHPNHKSLYHGAHAFLSAIMQRHAGWDCPIKMYSLKTTNVIRKYMSFFDTPATMIVSIARKKEKGQYPTPLLFVSGPRDYRVAQKAMTDGHKSQMVWFRWGYIGLSRYMIVNDLVKEKSP
jgi:N-acetylglucosaminylphosphatidylinositol deacetylase